MRLISIPNGKTIIDIGHTRETKRNSEPKSTSEREYPRSTKLSPTPRGTAKTAKPKSSEIIAS